MGIIAQDEGTKISRFFAGAKPCDYCKSAAALLFCRSDSAFMCIACDTKVHHSSGGGKHERVWMCEVCEQAPAAVTCKADAAALCFACDRDIHAANPLASRHERVPVVAFYDTAESVVMKSSAATALLADTGLFGGGQEEKIEVGHVDHHHDGYMPEPWVESAPIVANKVESQDLKSAEFLFSDSESFLDFDSYHQIPGSQQPYSDSMVPVQTTVKPPVPSHLHHDRVQGNRFEIDFTRSNFSSYSNGYTTPSLSHSVSSSSMDVGVVPDGSSLSDISYSFARSMNSSIDPSTNQGSQPVGMDREARVLRYKEKRKNRKFEKTIRYASRKAYAETRPRIKGRFAKRTDPESDIDRMFGTTLVNFATGSQYGVVPSF